MSGCNWLIGVCNTCEDGVSMYSFFGTKEEAKQKLVEMIDADRKKIEAEGYNEWEHGTEYMDYVEERGLWELYAYGCYSNFHIDYSAVELAHIEHA